MRHDGLWFGLLWDRDALNRRINARTKAMIAAGWLDEVRHLLKQYGQLLPTAQPLSSHIDTILHACIPRSCPNTFVHRACLFRLSVNAAPKPSINPIPEGSGTTVQLRIRLLDNPDPLAPANPTYPDPLPRMLGMSIARVRSGSAGRSLD